MSDLAIKFQDEIDYSKALSIASEMDDNKYRAIIFIYLADKFQNEALYSQALSELISVREIEDKKSKIQEHNYDYDEEDEEYTNEEDEEYYLDEDINYLTYIQGNRPFKSVYECMRYLAKRELPEKFYLELLWLTTKTKNQELHIYILIHLAEKLPNKNLYSEALKIAYQIDDEKSRIEALFYLAEKTQNENLYSEILEVTYQIDNEKYRAKVLSDLVHKSPKILPHRVIEAAREIENKKYSTEVLASSLLQFLPNQSYNQVFCIWQEILKNLFQIKRPELEKTIQTLIPVIHKLGAREALTEVATAIQDVGRWWP
ncbi:hypothetical protein H6G64_36040 [Calothrix sp. FACHB-156]|nr:hypothetical protein [Calothrix sp. FACHB-156]